MTPAPPGLQAGTRLRKAVATATLGVGTVIVSFRAFHWCDGSQGVCPRRAGVLQTGTLTKKQLPSARRRQDPGGEKTLAILHQGLYNNGYEVLINKTLKVAKGLYKRIASEVPKMISVKDYADKWGISTQAVYQQLKVHAAELEGHIHKVKGSNARWLDDDAVDILERIREVNPNVIERDTTSDTIIQLKNRVLELEMESKKKSEELLALERERAKDKDALKEAQVKLQLIEDGQSRELELQAAQYELKIREAEDRVKNEMQEKYNNLKAEMRAECKRKLTFKERITGKKQTEFYEG